MNREDLFQGLDTIDPKFICEAETVTQLEEGERFPALKYPVLILVTVFILLIGCGAILY